MSGDAELLLFEFGGDVYEAGGIAIDEEKIHAELGETADDFAADAGSGAGDEDFHAVFDAHGIAQSERLEKPEIVRKDTGLAGRVKRGCGRGEISCTFVYLFRLI